MVNPSSKNGHPRIFYAVAQDKHNIVEDRVEQENSSCASPLSQDKLSCKCWGHASRLPLPLDRSEGRADYPAGAKSGLSTVRVRRV